MNRRLAVACLALLVLLPSMLAGCTRLLGAAAPRSRTLYLVPIGQDATPSIEELARHYRDKYKLTVKTLSVVKVGEEAVDRTRRQLIAEELTALVRRAHPVQARERGAVVIAVTPHDMYIREKSWRFAFSWREDERFAVVSSARMNPTNLGQRADDGLLRARVRKMVTKNVGMLIFDRPLSDDPRSVLYKSIMGVDDLDRVGEEF